MTSKPAQSHRQQHNVVSPFLAGGGCAGGRRRSAGALPIRAEEGRSSSARPALPLQSRKLYPSESRILDLPDFTPLIAFSFRYELFLPSPAFTKTT